MENNDDLLTRIRRSQQSVNGEEQLNNSLDIPSQEIDTEAEMEQQNESKGLFETYAIPISPILTILLVFILTLARFVIFQSLEEADIIEMTVDSWGEYMALAVGYATYSYLRDCVKKWSEKKGKTKLYSFAIFICYLGILYILAALIHDLYYLFFG